MYDRATGQERQRQSNIERNYDRECGIKKMNIGNRYSWFVNSKNVLNAHITLICF